MEIFPLNKKKSGHVVYLGGHFQETVRGLGYKETALPRSLFFTFCGDILGSSGEHYEKGKDLTFFEATEAASLNFSDDFMESLAMHIMKDDETSDDVECLLGLKERFFDLIAAHFEKLSQAYSPWFGSIRDARDAETFLQVSYEHGSCGAPMRAAVMAADGLSDEKAFHLMLITHGHTEAIEGGFWVKGYGEAALRREDFEACLDCASERAQWARQRLAEFHKQTGQKRQEHPALNGFVKATLDKMDPYACIDDIAEEGIESRYVVSSVAYLLSLCHNNSNADQVIPELITKGLKVGGDPDTICSIALSLYGLRWPEPSSRFLEYVAIGQTAQI